MALLTILMFVFGVMGFCSNLFFRVIWLYCEWREGNTIEWPRQVLLTFFVPAAYTLVMVELMMTVGFVFVP
jgi:hypothetical protein